MVDTRRCVFAKREKKKVIGNVFVINTDCAEKGARSKKMMIYRRNGQGRRSFCVARRSSQSSGVCVTLL